MLVVGSLKHVPLTLSGGLDPDVPTTRQGQIDLAKQSDQPGKQWVNT